jgi:membrane fusion protein (multidrug efflux system)
MSCLQGKTEATRTKDSRAFLLLAAGAALAAVATVGMTGCSKSQAKTTSPVPGSIPVSVVKVRQSNVPLTGNWVGTLDGFVNAQIQPQVSGYLIRQEYR